MADDTVRGLGCPLEHWVGAIQVSIDDLSDWQPTDKDREYREVEVGVHVRFDHLCRSSRSCLGPSGCCQGILTIRSRNDSAGPAHGISNNLTLGHLNDVVNVRPQSLISSHI